MKFGFRKPSLKKRIAARTSWKRVVRHRLGFKAPRGFGWFTNPKKALYNRVYYRTTVDPVKLLTGGKKGRVGKKVTVVTYTTTRRKRSSFIGRMFKLGIVAGAIVICVNLFNSKPSVPSDSSSSSSPSQPVVQPPVQTPVAVAPVAPVTDQSSDSAVVSVPAPILPAPVFSGSSATVTGPTLDQQLVSAKHDEKSAEDRLTAAKDVVKKRVMVSPAYVVAKGKADEAKSIAVDQNYLDLSSAANLLIVDAQEADPAVHAAEADVRSKSAVVVGLEGEIRSARVAALASAHPATQPVDGTVADDGTGTVIYGASGSGFGSGGKTEHVSGYTRKDGTHVSGYNRRPH